VALKVRQNAFPLPAGGLRRFDLGEGQCPQIFYLEPRLGLCVTALPKTSFVAPVVRCPIGYRSNNEQRHNK